MRTIAIDCGHGGPDPGAVWRGLKEARVVRQIGLALATWMIYARGYRVEMVYDGTVTHKASFAERWDSVRMFNPCCYVSLHCNADPDADGPEDHIARGFELWIKPDMETTAHELAVCVDNQLRKVAGLGPSRGIKWAKSGGPAAVLRHPTCAALLCEVGFMDDPAFNSWIRETTNVEAVADAIACGVAEWIGGEA